MSYTADHNTSTLQFVLTTLLVVLLIPACSSFDVGGPKASARDPNAGILTLPSGRRQAILPEQFNFTGEGTYSWPDGRTQSGWFDTGQLHGLGEEQTLTDAYVGQWHEGQRHGHGELTRPGELHYVGDFADGQPHGQGRQTSPRGVYQGEWQHGKFDGVGQYKTHDGDTYDGQWRSGQRDGFGYQANINGTTYEGEWHADRRHGFGLQRRPDGSSYEGHWKNDLRDGYGSWSSIAGISYSGTWRSGRRHGYGEERTPDGSVYQGNWADGQRHGSGTEHHLDGSSHTGSWVNGTIAGEGTRVTASGLQLTGHWQGDALTDGRLLLPSGATYDGTLFGAGGKHFSDQLLTWLQDRADADDPDAQYLLGLAYLDFSLPQPDPNIARRWLDKAAAQGHAFAQYRLAGLLTSIDAQRALQLLQEAARHAHPGAHALLGEYHYVGRFVQQDTGAAIAHYQAAADKGDINAANNLAWLLATVDDDTVADPDRAVQLIRPFALFFEHWQYLDTLAAAHARRGETDLAARLQRQVIQRAEQDAGAAVIEAMRQRLALYEAALPFTE